MVELAPEGGRVVLDCSQGPNDPKCNPLVRRVVVCDLEDTSPAKLRVALAFPEENRDCFCEDIPCWRFAGVPHPCFEFLSIPDITGIWEFWENSIIIAQGTWLAHFDVDAEYLGDPDSPSALLGYAFPYEDLLLQLGTLTISGGGSTWGTVPLYLHTSGGEGTVGHYAVEKGFYITCNATPPIDQWRTALHMYLYTWPGPGSPLFDPPFPWDHLNDQFGHGGRITFTGQAYKTDNHGCPHNGLQWNQWHSWNDPDFGWNNNNNPFSFYFHD